MANIELLIPKILFWEGGYNNDPDDKGNWYDGKLIGTKYGISAPILAKYLGRCPTPDEMKNLDHATFRDIAVKGLWTEMHGTEINNQIIAEFLYDWKYNGGPAVKTIQKMVGVEPDGVMGQQTVSAINSYGNDRALFEGLKQARIAYLESIATGKKAKYLKGWLNRVNSFNYE